MKALIISEDNTVSSSIDSFLQNNNVDTIIYKWLLKALDNVEEIRPNLIIINAVDFPRLWKTLAQFVKSGIGGNEISIYLYVQNSLSEEDEKKFQQLGIDGVIKSLKIEDLNQIIKCYDSDYETADENVREAESESEVLPEVKNEEPEVTVDEIVSKNQDETEAFDDSFKFITVDDLLKDFSAVEDNISAEDVTNENVSSENVSSENEASFASVDDLLSDFTEEKQTESVENSAVFASVDDLLGDFTEEKQTEGVESSVVFASVDDLLDDFTEEKQTEGVESSVVFASVDDLLGDFTEEKQTESVENSAVFASVDDLFENEEIPTVNALITNTFIFTHPQTNLFICGNVEDYSENQLVCHLNFNCDFNLNDTVKNISCCINNELKDYSGKIQDYVPAENKLILQINS